MLRPILGFAWLPSLVTAVSCVGTPPPPVHLAAAPTVCYRLRFTWIPPESLFTWIPAEALAFANAPIGAVTPLPDTIGLTRVRFATRRAWPHHDGYAIAWPSTQQRAAASWSSFGQSLSLLIPSTSSWLLWVNIIGSGDSVSGRAAVSHRRDFDPSIPRPSGLVTAYRVSCPTGMVLGGLAPN